MHNRFLFKRTSNKYNTMKDEFIYKKVNDALNSLDNISRASPRQFLFTRVEARMQNERNMWAKLSSFVANPVVAFACICFVLILNAMVILFSGNAVSSHASQGNELVAADEYN